jgi:hypothetical protein
MELSSSLSVAGVMSLSLRCKRRCGNINGGGPPGVDRALVLGSEGRGAVVVVVGAAEWEVCSLGTVVDPESEDGGTGLLCPIATGASV